MSLRSTYLRHRRKAAWHLAYYLDFVGFSGLLMRMVGNRR